VTALETPRLRLLFVTPPIAQAAAEGQDGFARAINAEIDPDWRGGHIFERARRVLLDDRPVHALIILKRERLLVGELRFEPLREGVYEIGYAICPAHRRQRLATEAAAALIAWLDEGIGASRIVAGCAMSNKASVRTLRRLGFELDSSTKSGAFWWTWAPAGLPGY
jgi:RimJ/RimL family protein N-acetyltransferase